MLHCALSLCLLVPQSPPEPPASVVIEGRVVDLRGEGVPMATVEVTARWQRDQVLAKGMCDGDGYFRLGHLAPRPAWRVQASKPGLCTAAASVLSTSPSVRVQLHDATTVRGVLRDRAGQPVPGAIVRAEVVARILHDLRCDARTDDSGAFTLTGVPLAFVRLTALVPGEGVAELERLVSGEALVELTMGTEPTTSLEITVTGLPGPAIAMLTASVLPYRPGRLVLLPPPWDRPQFDASGRVVMANVPDLEYRVAPVADGYAFAPRELVAAAHAGPHRLQFNAIAVGSTALRCPARLVDGDGKPLAGVRLAMRASNAARGGPRAEATSDGDGALVFESLEAAGSKVIVSSLDPRWVLDQEKQPDLIGVPSDRGNHECEVQPSATLQLCALPACSVRGLALRDDGRPAAFVEVELESDNIGWRTFGIAVTDRSGAFAITGRHYRPGAVRVHVEGVEGAGASEPFALAAQGTDVKLPDLKLSPPATVEGTVVDAQQRPAAGVRVQLLGGKRGEVEVITDHLGRYRFVGVPSGKASLRLLTDKWFAGSPVLAAEPFAVEPGKTLSFALQLPAK